MKKAYIGVFSILLVGLVVFAVLSFFGDSIETATGLKTGSFNQTLLKPVAKVDTSSQKKKPSKPKRVLDKKKKCILFIGDSMLEGLKPRLAAYAEKNGHDMNAVIWYSSTTEIWGSSGKVTEYIKKFKPDYIFISLGANELFVDNIKEKRSKFVKKIIEEIGDIPYIWIGPPNWKPDTGFNEMVQSIVPVGQYYLSYTPDQHYDRTKDGAHPTRPSARKWMDRVCKWVMDKSDFPIRLTMPDPTVETAKCHTEILQPVQ